MTDPQERTGWLYVLHDCAVWEVHKRKPVSFSHVTEQPLSPLSMVIAESDKERISLDRYGGDEFGVYRLGWSKILNRWIASEIRESGLCKRVNDYCREKGGGGLHEA